MKIIENGNIFDSKCLALVNPVNCVGICGAGLALAFKHKYPNNYQQYKSACKDNLIRPGVVFITGINLYPSEDDPNYNHRVIINFPTKDHWKNPSKIEYIEQGLQDLANHTVKHCINSIAFPLLGCGLGGLYRENVVSLILNFDKYVNSITRQQKELQDWCSVELYI